ncbi:MAG: hypothetical protein KGM44_06430 [bacterium]|nr:hypothetical protein [bacterium]
MTAATIAEADLLAVYRALGGDPSSARRIGRETLVRCVALSHADEHPSLRLDADKRVWRCDPCSRGGGVLNLIMLAGAAHDRAEAAGWLVEHGLLADGQPTNGRAPTGRLRDERVAAAYDYTDEFGELLYQVQRLEGADEHGARTKRFRQRRPDGSGGWAWSLGDVRRVPYRLPELRAACAASKVVYVVEGERCAEALREIGLAATTSSGGAAWRWPDDYAGHFLGAKGVTVAADSDAPGRCAAEQRAGVLARAGIATKIIDLAHKRDDGYDIADAIAEGMTRATLVAIVSATPTYEPEADGEREEMPSMDATAPALAPVEWDDPRPWPTLDDAALYGLVGDVTRVIGGESEGDPAAILTTFLACFGAAVGLGPHVRIGAIRHPARIFVAHMGATGSGRKGQAFGDGSLLIEEAEPEWWAATFTSGLASGEGLIAKLAPRDDAAPEPHGHAAMVYEPEFARLLAAASRDGSTLSAVVRDAWDRSRLEVRTRKEPLVADQAHVSIIAQITPEELRARLTTIDVANGFVNRFLLIACRRSKLLPRGGNLRSGAVQTLIARTRQAIAAARRIGEATLTPDADASWAVWYHRNAGIERGGLLGAVLGRPEAQVLRLALIYALADGVYQIGVAHLLAARAVWEYAAAGAAHLLGAMVGNPKADRLLAELRAIYPAGLDGRQIDDLLHGRGAEQARAELVRGNLAEEETVETGGRPRRIIRAKPRTPTADNADNADKATGGDLYPHNPYCPQENAQLEPADVGASASAEGDPIADGSAAWSAL